MHKGNKKSGSVEFDPELLSFRRQKMIIALTEIGKSGEETSWGQGERRKIMGSI